MVTELDFCVLEFHNNYVICRMHEDEAFNAKKSEQQTKTILNFYKENPFVYITHRVNSYWVDPNIYTNSSKISTLIGFCVVSDNLYSLDKAKIEKQFLNKPFKLFTNLKDAVNWSEAIILLYK